MRVDLVSIRGAGVAGPSPGLLSQWRVGAILQAVAVRDAPSGRLWLNIGDTLYPARIASGDQSGPAHGERLQLRVLRNSPVLALETIETEASPARDIAADALRRHVPRQLSPTLLLANLAWLARNGAGIEALPRDVMHAAARLWQALPQAATLTDPDGLKAAVERSGTFLEHRLSGSSGAPSGASIATDLKALLLNFARVLRASGARPLATMADANSAPVPTVRGPLAALPAAPATLSAIDGPAQQLNELARQTEGALARLTTVQLTHTPQEGSAQAALIELPVRYEDRTSLLRMRVERDGAGGHAEAQESWTLEAAMELGAAGALHARVSLSGHRVAVRLRAESAAVVDALSARSDELESVLRAAGLEVERVVCLHGMPAGDASAQPARLLDIRA
ncbi:MAG: hypothetical protein DIU71_05870 [Proteobacteria bacterium]|nr:MAG: hypothetical protein DIU71_05870 [Pseudomonadota bacterium]